MKTNIKADTDLILSQGYSFVVYDGIYSNEITSKHRKYSCAQKAAAKQIKTGGEFCDVLNLQEI